jgi:hypothetical protein
MIQLTEKQYSKIHKDFKGTMDDGKKRAFNSSVRSAAGLKGWGELSGTSPLVEGIDFEITKSQ